ncbi:NAD(P)/FAD-dependent oxidoreductase [Amycolatopsis rubida]|uniref:3-phenylpropionate/trans-cinnamate dioxygenase ferredoxin reductase subunit n=1 Tax=Amycolatopsis rubida TaxID=112413 RepID=A0A1I5NCL3_9PSEU|nr:FAD-dependent oxidoreductase [Amycolatopsis rubida]SFP19519.1 3-phenylpropionate/trans-cinnamate dioxygenase ferredoxin reductase subunit [Amycolatopsis rubida]
MDSRHFVIVGGGTCAGAAARTLRAEGFDGQLTIISNEPVPPYERPPLSKQFLTGEVAADDLAINPVGWYAENKVDLLLETEASTLDTTAKTMTLDDGRRLGYDTLLLATGGRPRRLPDLDSDRVLYLRGIEDARRLAEHMSTGDRVVVLGGGFIGCEVAASARGLGLEATMLEMLDVPLQRVLGAELGEIIAQVHRDAGVDVRTGERVESVRDTGSGLRITTDRAVLDCGALLVAVGLQPNTELAEAAGIACDNGILVDAHCRTSATDVYAAGDVASHFHTSYNRHVRVEHHDNAIKQGAAAAKNMLGRQTPFTDQHWFWSDQYDHSLQSVGIATGHDEIVLRGDTATRQFSAFFCKDGQVLSVFALDRGKDIIGGRKLITAGLSVTAEQLRDESVNLARLVPRPTSQQAPQGA